MSSLLFVFMTLLVFLHLEVLYDLHVRRDEDVDLQGNVFQIYKAQTKVTPYVQEDSGPVKLCKVL